MTKKFFGPLMVVAAVYLLCGRAASGAGSAGQWEAPSIRIEGEVVEVDADAGVLVVRYEQRGARTRRAFQITKDTAFPRADSDGDAPVRLAGLKAGDRIIVSYHIRNARAVAISVQKLRPRKS